MTGGDSGKVFAIEIALYKFIIIIIIIIVIIIINIIIVIIIIIINLFQP